MVRQGQEVNMNKIKVIVKRADEEVGHMTNISNTLENLQKTVGGYIETVTLPCGVVVICDEEGRLKGKPYNCTVFPQNAVERVSFVGDIIVCGARGAEFADVPIDMKMWRKLFLGKGEE
jgi:hypothetical protein